MVAAILLILIGFALLIKGADFLVEGSSNIAKKFHIPEIIIGLTIVSIGTSMPEMFVSLTSGMEGYPDMAMGNVIGSNVCNLFLILGLSTVIRTVKFQRETRLIEIPMCLLITILFMVLCNMGEGLSRVDGIILLVTFMFQLFIDEIEFSKRNFYILVVTIITTVTTTGIICTSLMLFLAFVYKKFEVKILKQIKYILMKLILFQEA